MTGFSRLSEVQKEVRQRQGGLTRTAHSDTWTVSAMNDSSRARWFGLVFDVKVRKNERGIVFKDGDFVEFLAPGETRYFQWGHHYSVERYDLSCPLFEHRLIDYWLTNDKETMDDLFHVVVTQSHEVAAIFQNDRLTALIGPSQRRLYWRAAIDVRIERYDLEVSLTVPPALSKRLAANRPLVKNAVEASAIVLETVPSGHIGILSIDGQRTDRLTPGLHVFWAYRNTIDIELVDLRIRSLEVQGQEILSRDKVALRINVTASFRFEDAEKAYAAVEDPLGYLYKEIQFGLRAAVGTRALDALLDDKTVIDQEVTEYLQARFADLGLVLLSVGVKDIILPGDMKALLGKVVEAEKVAQANVIRRREETNATRSLLNTAKVMESNTVALRLKELETLEKITEKIGTLSVYGGLDSLLNQLVSIKKE